MKFIVPLVFSVLVGSLYLTPPLAIFRHFDGAFLLNRDRYSDELLLYAPRAREVADGHFPPSDLFYSGETPALLTVNPLPPVFLGVFVALFGDINRGYLAALFFFGATLFCLFYFLGRLIFRNWLWGLVIGLVGTLTPMVIHLPRAFLSPANFLNIVLKNFIPLVKTPLDKLFLARFDDPLLTLPIYLLAVIFFFWFWEKPAWWPAVGAGFLAGVLFYTYFHYWFFWTVALGIIFLATLIFWRSDRERLRYFLILLTVLTITALPYLVSYLEFTNLRAHQEFLLRFNVQFGRGSGFATAWPDMLFYVLLSIVIYAVYFKKDKPKALLFWCLLLTAFIIWHTQIFFGFVPSLEHWRKAIGLIIFIMLLDLLAVAVSKVQAKKAIAGLLLVLAALLITKKIVNTAVVQSLPPAILEQYPYPEEVIASLDWIKKNLAGEPKIVSPSFITSYYLLSYTSARPFLPTGLLTLASNEDLERRFLLANKVFGITEEILEKRLRGTFRLDCSPACYPHTNKNLNATKDDLYSEYFRNRETESNAIPEGRIRLLLDNYEELTADWFDIESDYVYFGPWEKQFGDLLVNDPRLKIVYQTPLVVIYELGH